MATGQSHEYVPSWRGHFALYSYKALSGHVPYKGEGIVLDFLPEFTFRKANVNELADAFITEVFKFHEDGDPYFHIADSYVGYMEHLHGVTPGTKEHDSVFWRPDLAHLSAEYLNNGIPAGFINRMAYTYPLSDQPDPNHLYIVPTNSTEQTITMQSISGSDGDVLLILNPPNSKTRLYYDSTPGQGGGELVVSPNTFISAIWRNDQWEKHNLTVGDVVQVQVYLSAQLIRERDHRKRPVKYVKGKLLAKSNGNIRSNRNSTAYWKDVQSPATLLQTNKFKMYTPDFTGDVMGLWIEVNTKPDGSGTVISNTFALEGQRTYFRCTPRSETSYHALSVDSDFDSGKREWEIKYGSNDSSNFGYDAYVLAYELRMQV